MTYVMYNIENGSVSRYDIICKATEKTFICPGEKLLREIYGKPVPSAHKTLVEKIQKDRV